MSRPKLKPKPGDVVCTPDHILATVDRVEGDTVEVVMFDKLVGYYKVARFNVRQLRKVHYLTTE
jgi:hypothetical protein